VNAEMMYNYWPERERRSLDTLSVKKEAKLSAGALAEVQVGRGEEELRCNNLFIVCQRRRRLSAGEDGTLMCNNSVYEYDLSNGAIFNDLE